MSVMPLLIIAFNVLLYAGLGSYALSMKQKSTSRAVRLLWALTALPAFAVVIGGVQRLTIQAVRLGWLSTIRLELILSDWQSGQSILVTLIGITAVLGIRRVARRLGDVESLAGALLDRVAAVDVDSLDLTPRERDVLKVLGGSDLVDNTSLAEKLGVSRETVHTHINALLRKTKLHDRRDLAVVAYLHESRKA